MRIRFPSLLLLAVLATTTSVQAQNRDAELLNLMEEAGIPGLGVAVLLRGELSYVRTFGVRSNATSPRADTSSVFEAASLTKPIVAYIAMQLVDEGVLNLDRPLSDYVTYPDVAHSSRAAGITARMVLSHTSGLPNWRPSAGRLDLVNAPGQTFSYSGEGFLYLQRAIEALLSRPLHAAADDRVFLPMGMTSSGLIWKEEFRAVIAVGHSATGLPFDKFVPTEANAAYSLHTTPSDYARFLANVLAGEGLSTESVSEMNALQADAEEGVSWGLGWGRERTSRGQALWHWGDNRGYKAFVAGYPGQGRGFVVLTNSDNGMLALHRLVEILDDTPHPAVNWLDYERFDTPSFQAGRALQAALADSTAPSLRTVYSDLKKRFDRDAFNEDTLNDLGYRLLRAGEGQSAIAILELNVSEYPNAANPYDSLGEAYMLAGELDKALLNYRVSVELDPENTNGKAMIARLEAQLNSGSR
ncbi:MAG: CubicO group peptidase (beta-lactamase class C family) [Rhodothermales bacterium]|jgi:CubicO group peptidase (beta-lactamase class C family)